MTLRAVGSDPGDWAGTHVTFAHLGPRPGNKTSDWAVRERSGGDIGTIKWFPRWRKYGFFPCHGTVYEETCLREIAEFCQARTADRKKGI